jgi:hypothetical protein
MRKISKTVEPSVKYSKNANPFEGTHKELSEIVMKDQSYIDTTRSLVQGLKVDRNKLAEIALVDKMNLQVQSEMEQ